MQTRSNQEWNKHRHLPGLSPAFRWPPPPPPTTPVTAATSPFPAAFPPSPGEVSSEDSLSVSTLPSLRPRLAGGGMMAREVKLSRRRRLGCPLNNPKIGKRRGLREEFVTPRISRFSSAQGRYNSVRPFFHGRVWVVCEVFGEKKHTCSSTSRRITVSQHWILTFNVWFISLSQESLAMEYKVSKVRRAMRLQFYKSPRLSENSIVSKSCYNLQFSKSEITSRSNLRQLRYSDEYQCNKYFRQNDGLSDRYHGDQPIPRKDLSMTHKEQQDWKQPLARNKV